MYDIGLRVIRGPDWHWDNQDGGEGCVGTVSEFGTRMSPDKTVVVLWDIGYRTNYRIGYDGSYDLRIFDNASIGVNQTRIMCNGCKIRDFSGMRFKCARCYDYDLCLECYMKDHHDLSHSFRRYETSSSHDFVEIPPRENSVKWQIKGIFPGAQVIRGLDWDWNDQDGGSGHVGNVTDIRGWDTETNRSVASITWLKTGVKNVYRVGHKGKVDIRCVKPAVWGYCYVDHLPVLGQPSHCLPRAVENVVLFSSGEKVKVNVSEDRLKVLQEGHGGWNPRMIQYIGEVGVVHRVTDKGDVRVQFEHCNNRWTFHPAALIKINRFKVGDLVRMIDDVSKVKELQKGHGEWLDIMATDIGKIGKVAKIYSDGDLRVNINDQSWTLNPSCIEPIAEIASMSNPNGGDTTEELRRAVDGITQIIENLERSGETSLENILQQVEAGNLEFLDKFFPKSRARENLVRNGKTCLHIACHEGQSKLVRFLLSLGANAQTQDNEGDTALHYATYGNQPAVLEILLNHDATNVNKVNKNLCSALHIAVNKQFYQCAKVLLRFHCDANLQDSFGDTALHDAVGKGDVDLVDLLCNESNINYALVNKQGFNVIHMCALKGHVSIMEKLFQKARHLVDRKKDDGFAAIHLSSLNGYVAVTRMLIVKGRTDINLRNSRNQTPLHLAVSQKRYSVVELLVELGADVNAQDANGDTILHLILDNKKGHSFSADFNAEEAPNIYQVFNKFNATDSHSEIYMLASIICYLMQCGCCVATKNVNNVSPLQLIRKNQSLFDILNTVPESISIFRLELNADSNASVSTTSLPRESNAENATTNASCKTANAEIGSENVARTQVECLICSELSDQNVTLKPCDHKIACEECSSRMKKCIECRQVITKRITRDGRVVCGKTRQKSAERVKYLEGKIAEIEEVHCCPICMERSRNVVFLCGHGACDRCCLTLTMCHMCRTLITKKISLY